MSRPQTPAQSRVAGENEAEGVKDSDPVGDHREGMLARQRNSCSRPGEAAQGLPFQITRDLLRERVRVVHAGGGGGAGADRGAGADTGAGAEVIEAWR